MAVDLSHLTLCYILLVEQTYGIIWSPFSYISASLLLPVALEAIGYIEPPFVREWHRVKLGVKELSGLDLSFAFPPFPRITRAILVVRSRE